MLEFQTTITKIALLAFIALLLSLAPREANSQVSSRVEIERAEPLWPGFPTMIPGDAVGNPQYIIPTNPVSAKRIIEFRARGTRLGKGEPGHAYVLTGTEYDNGLIVYDRIAGFFPEKGGVQRALGPGKIDAYMRDIASTDFLQYDDNGELLKDKDGNPLVYQDVDYLRVEVDDGQFDLAQKEIENWQEGQTYNVALNNCVSFAKSVAEKVGINTDGISDKPSGFIKELRSRHSSQRVEERFSEALDSANESATNLIEERARTEVIRNAEIREQIPYLEAAIERQKQAAAEAERYYRYLAFRNQFYSWLYSQNSGNRPPPVESEVGVPDNVDLEVQPPPPPPPPPPPTVKDQPPLINPWSSGQL